MRGGGIGIGTPAFVSPDEHGPPVFDAVAVQCVSSALGCLGQDLVGAFLCPLLRDEGRTWFANMAPYPRSAVAVLVSAQVARVLQQAATFWF